MIEVDLLVLNAGQLVTCAGAGRPKRGADMSDVGLIEDGGVAVAGGRIVAVGTTADLQRAYAARRMVDACGRVVCPGFVDPHTHAVYAGDRVHEFEMRVQGAGYMEIMAAGGGIVSTVARTREATAQQLIHATRPRLDTMLAHGTTTAEIKSGYGLETRSELTMLRVIEQLDSEHPIDLVPTFLGAHTTPPERNSDSEGYLEAVIDEMLPEVVSWYERSGFSARQVPLFCDVFLEDHAFNVAQSERLLRIAQELGLPSKLHVDQFNSLGGIPMGIDLGAISVDHLEVTTGDDIQRLGASDTIAVLLPAVNFNLGLTNFANGRALVAAGAVVALGTDLNPGSSPCFSMPLVMAIATRYLGLSPAEALNAATINAAHAIGLGDCAGSLEAGKQADLVMIDAPDYRHLAYLLGVNLVHTVIKRGEIVVGA